MVNHYIKYFNNEEFLFNNGDNATGNYLYGTKAKG